jgi:FSR family fosmidomycin resistance protein-like MFS transporter
MFGLGSGAFGGSGINARKIGVLSFGHFTVDIAQGAVPALLPFLVADRGFSVAQASVLVLALVGSSSIIQPIFGRMTDLRPMPWILPAAVITSGVGIAAVGFVSSYLATLAVVLVAGVGVAAYHPEGARYANYVSGNRRATGMSVYAVGGNAGFAFGPVIVTPLALVFGLDGTAALLILPLVAAAILTHEIPGLRAAAPSTERRAQVSKDAHDNWAAFGRLTAMMSFRSAIFYGMATFVPLYFVIELGTSKALGNTALSVMLISGAIATLIGGRLADHFERRKVVWISMIPLAPFLLLFLVGGPAVAIVAAALIGAATVGTFSVTLVMGQEYLPNHVGVASGVTLGLAIGLGGVGAALLGVFADASGIPAAIVLIAILPIPALALALTLPAAERPRQDPTPLAPGAGAGQAAEAGRLP